MGIAKYKTPKGWTKADSRKRDALMEKLYGSKSKKRATKSVTDTTKKRQALFGKSSKK